MCPFSRNAGWENKQHTSNTFKQFIDQTKKKNTIRQIELKVCGVWLASLLLFTFI